MRRIKYTGKIGQGKSFKISDESFDEVSKYKWSLNNRGYACSNIKINGKWKSMTLHRFLMNFPDSLIDHCDRDKSNCQLDNLRLASFSENCINQKTREDSTSGYKGVSWHKHRRKWEAQIQVNKQKTYIGIFKSKIEAAKAYDKKAKELFGEYAKLNFV